MAKEEEKRDKMFGLKCTADELEQIAKNASNENFDNTADFARAKLLYLNTGHSDKVREKIDIALRVVAGVLNAEDITTESGKTLGIPLETQRKMDDEWLKQKAVEVLRDFLLSAK